MTEPEELEGDGSTLGDVLDMLGATLRSIADPPPKLARTQVGGFIVSTVNSYDQGLETAIIAENQTAPVQRYLNREDALKGHQYWVGFLQKQKKTIIQVKMLGMVPSEDEETELTPMSEKTAKELANR